MSPRLLSTRGAAALLAAGTLAACDPSETPQFVPETGTASGVVFLDADNDGIFTPTQGDSLRPGAIVRIVERGSRTVQLATATADANGRFSVVLKAGTHDVVVDSASVAPRAFCGGQRVTVRAAEPAFANVFVRGGCVIRIDTAKTRARNTTVTVAGIVTAAPGRFRQEGDNLYIQNATGNQGGIQLFGAGVRAPSPPLQEGDSIEVTGDLSNFNTESQLVNPRIAANVRRAVRTVVPVVLRTGQADSSRTPTNPLNLTTGANPLPAVLNGNIGRLIQYRRARVVTAATTGTPPSGANIEVTDGSSPVQAQVRIAGTTFTGIGIARFVVGRCYDITGVLGVFNNRPQLLPRTNDDVVEVACP